MSFTISVVIILIGIIVVNNGSNNKITGKWITENGQTIEFLSDGTIHRGGYDSLHADTYGITDKGYLKWGAYDAAWIAYRYTYWDIEISGNYLTLISRNNSDYKLELKRE